MANFNILMKAGPLRNGAERGHGSVFHCVEGTGADFCEAICGEKPSIQWSSWAPKGQRVTCERCLKLISILQSADDRGVIRPTATKGFAGRAFIFNAARLLKQFLISPNAHGDYYITDRGRAVLSGIQSEAEKVPA